MADGVVYADSGDGKLYAVDASTGAGLWNFTFRDALGALESSPVVANGEIYVGSDNNNLYAFDLSG